MKFELIWTLGRNKVIPKNAKEKDDKYYVSISTIKQLLDLKEEIGGKELVITENWNDKNLKVIEVYDGYRE